MKKVAIFYNAVTCVIFTIFAGLYFYQGYTADNHLAFNTYGYYYVIMRIVLSVTSLFIGGILLLIVYILANEQRDFITYRCPFLARQILLISIVVTLLLFVEVQFLGITGISVKMAIALLGGAFAGSLLGYFYNVKFYNAHQEGPSHLPITMARSLPKNPQPNSSESNIVKPVFK